MHAGEYLVLLTVARDLKDGGEEKGDFEEIMNVAEGTKRSELLTFARLEIDRRYDVAFRGLVEMRYPATILFFDVQPNN